MPKVDRIGRPQQDPDNPFRGIDALTRMAGWIPNREVPPEFWALEGEEAAVCCPCGNTPVVPLLEAPVPCGCGRWFAFDSVRVWAFGAAGNNETT